MIWNACQETSGAKKPDEFKDSPSTHLRRLQTDDADVLLEENAGLSLLLLIPTYFCKGSANDVSDKQNRISMMSSSLKALLTLPPDPFIGGGSCYTI